MLRNYFDIRRQPEKFAFINQIWCPWKVNCCILKKSSPTARSST